jgi:hypothetical protein
MKACPFCERYKVYIEINWSDPRTVERLRKELMMHQQHEHPDDKYERYGPKVTTPFIVEKN